MASISTNATTRTSYSINSCPSSNLGRWPRMTSSLITELNKPTKIQWAEISTTSIRMLRAILSYSFIRQLKWTSRRRTNWCRVVTLIWEVIRPIRYLKDQNTRTRCILAHSKWPSFSHRSVWITQFKNLMGSTSRKITSICMILRHILAKIKTSTKIRPSLEPFRIFQLSVNNSR